MTSKSFRRQLESLHILPHSTFTTGRSSTMQQSTHTDSDSSSDSGLSLYRHRNHKQRFQLDNYIVKELGSGDEACVFASIPKRSANQILLAY
jgi:hypothetical protein